MPWQPKDPAALAVSLLALAVSLIVFLITYFQKRGETTQARRKQLTDTLKELSDLNLKVATFRALPKKDGYPSNYIGLLADQRRFFVRQAALLSDSLGDLVSPHEKNLIAASFDGIDFVEDAHRFFKSAAEQSGEPIDNGLAWRNYGRFLIHQGLSKEGTAAYEKAIQIFSVNDDRNLSYRSSTYTRWAESERNEGCGDDRVRELLGRAWIVTEGVRNKRRREAEFDRIREVSANLGVAPPGVVTGIRD